MMKIKKCWKLFCALFPSRVPISGVTEFNAWADSIIEIGAFPTQHRDSIVFALASMVMHLGQSGFLNAYKPKMYFILAVRAGAAKQIASAVFQEIKLRQQAELAAAKKLAEDTAAKENGSEKDQKAPNA
jgi:hypothetical protein